MQKGDICYAVKDYGKIVGVVWWQIMNDCGHIDDNTHSLAILLFKEHRKYEIGTELMK